MPKTKTGAQKAEEREARNEERRVEREREKEARELQFKKGLEETRTKKLEGAQGELSSPLSKKEQKKLVKSKMKRGDLSDTTEKNSTPFATEAQASTCEPPTGSFIEDRKYAEEIERLSGIDFDIDLGKARTTMVHATHCPSLRSVIARLERKLPGCTIIPGASHSCSSKSETFALRFQREEQNSFKFVAREGHTAQEIYIKVPSEFYTLEALENSIAESIEDKANKSARPREDMDLHAFNRARYEHAKSQWKATDKEIHDLNKEKQDQRIEEDKVARQRRKLRGKVPSSLVDAYAERDAKIVDGTLRTKHSMG